VRIRKLALLSAHRFFTDAYDLFVIGVVKPMIAIVYYPALNGKARTRSLYGFFRRVLWVALH
jgi:hypothetical protein